MHSLRAAVLAALVFPLVALAESPELAPPPRGHWVLDTTGTVSAATVAELDSVASEVEAAGAGQLGVLVVNTTAGAVPRTFATTVFNRWGVGHAGSNDGILLFAALKDRKAEIVLGVGSKVTSSQTDVVMRDDVVANFKRGQVDAGLLAAARSLSRLMRAAGQGGHPTVDDNQGLGGNLYVVPPSVPDLPDTDENLMMLVRKEAPFPERSPRSWVVDLTNTLAATERAQLDVAASEVYAESKGRIFFLVMRSTARWPDLGRLVPIFVDQVDHQASTPLAVIAVDLRTHEAVMHLPPERVDGAWERSKLEEVRLQLERGLTADDVEAMKEAAAFASMALTRGIPPRPMGDVLREGFERSFWAVVSAGAAVLFGLIYWLRRWLRFRPRSCAHCGSARQLLGDAAEDQHLTSAQKTEESVGSVDYDVWWCGRCRDALVVDNTSWFSFYSRCPSCSARTLRSTTTTISRATEWSTGSERVDTRCANCSYSNSYTRTTARLTRSTSSSSSSSRSWSSSSSFGGGRSSGGGSSGSW